MANYLKRYIDEDGHFKATVINGTDIGRELYRRFQPSPIGLQLMSQMSMGTLLMAANLKGEGTIQLSCKGEGPIESLTFEANTHGGVRGFARNPHTHFDLTEGQGLFQQAIGSGQMSVKRRVQPSDQVYTSVVDLVPGEIAVNLAHYLTASDQIPSAIQLGALLSPEHGVAGAGGVLIQALPNADENVLFILEDRLLTMKPLGELFASGDGHAEALDHLFYQMNVKEVGFTEIGYRCQCNRGRILQVTASLPLEELVAFRQEKEPLEMSCSFCGATYTISDEDLDVLIEERGKNA